MPSNMKEVQSFMDGHSLASFVTVSLENAPHVVPVFFTYEDGKVYVQTGRNSVQVRNLLKNNNVAVAVYSDQESVIIKGKGRIIEDDKDFVKRTEDHISKYRLKLDKQGRDSVGIPLFDKKIRCVIEVTSNRIMFW
ncbi:MAG: pyridoxamine 5'-phosphate oxidase family protein [Candidatus Bathyarchaeota archaeon]|nr:pyridoxamine 5'-phosphate oxidase family protein [Candidatus Bathyarchaeota archaeon]